MATLPLTSIVDVIINLSPRATRSKEFNTPLFLGTSPVIDLEDRVQIYSSTQSMLDAGFTYDSDEYRAANIYFSQTPTPNQLAVGRWDSENEELLDALTACRSANSEWHILMMPKATTPENVKITASFIESAQPSSLFIYANDWIDTTTELHGLNYRRTMAVITKQIFTHVAAVGKAMGWQTGTVNSTWDLYAKSFVGVAVDNWTENEIREIQAVNGNYYVNRGGEYDVFENSEMLDGTWFDEMVNLDKMANDITLAYMDLLQSVRKIPQTETGVEMIRNILIPVLNRNVSIGFIAPGIWTAPGILNLATNEYLANGYLIQSQSLADQTRAERDNRKAPDFYIAIKLAGSMHDITISVDVNR